MLGLADVSVDRRAAERAMVSLELMLPLAFIVGVILVLRCTGLGDHQRHKPADHDGGFGA